MKTLTTHSGIQANEVRSGDVELIIESVVGYDTCGDRSMIENYQLTLQKRDRIAMAALLATSKEIEQYERSN
jgi:DNA polymerase/3'-5' exonuclease PolX